MPKPDLDAARRSISATLNEICAGEQDLKAKGIDVHDEGEWMQLRDIVARIERKLRANSKGEAA